MKKCTCDSSTISLYNQSSSDNLKYFSKLEIKNYQTKYIKTLFVEDELITDPSKVLEAQKVFYENLYKQIEVLEINRELFDNIWTAW